jgi:peroxiredoxin
MKYLLLTFFLFSFIGGLTSFSDLEKTYKIDFLPPALKVGDKAKDFRLKNVNGKMVSLKDFNSAKGFIVIFTCNHCPFAQAYESRIQELNNKFSKKGYPVIAINPNDPKIAPDDSYELMQERAKEKKYTFPYLFDEGQKVYPEFGASRTPQVYLLDKNLIVKYIGAIDDNAEEESAVKSKYVESAVLSLMKNKTIDPNFTKAIGCTIKKG